MSAKDLMREALKDYTVYVAGNMAAKPIPGKPVAKLNLNENQMGPSSKAIEAMTAELPLGHLYAMDALMKLKKKISEYVNKPVEYITTFGGSGGGIQCIAETFLNPDDELLLCSPTYMAYYRLPARFGAKLVEVEADDGVSTDLDKLEAAITDKTKLIFICNPNNPTGTLLCPDKLKKFVDNLPSHVICVIDEAYIDWVGNKDYPSAISWIEEGKNIIVLRTFSKIFGLAGCRIGYSVANSEITKCLGSIAASFNTNRIGAVGATAALDDKEYYEAAYNNNLEQREYLSSEMKRMGMDIVESNTSFIYYAPHCDTKEYMDYLASKNVFIRGFTEEYVRVSIGLPWQNQMFLDASEEFLAMTKKIAV